MEKTQNKKILTVILLAVIACLAVIGGYIGISSVDTASAEYYNVVTVELHINFPTFERILEFTVDVGARGASFVEADYDFIDQWIITNVRSASYRVIRSFYKWYNAPSGTQKLPVSGVDVRYPRNTFYIDAVEPDFCYVDVNSSALVKQYLDADTSFDLAEIYNPLVLEKVGYVHIGWSEKPQASATADDIFTTKTVTIADKGKTFYPMFREDTAGTVTVKVFLSQNIDGSGAELKTTYDQAITVGNEYSVYDFYEDAFTKIFGFVEDPNAYALDYCVLKTFNTSRVDVYAKVHFTEISFLEFYFKPRDFIRLFVPEYVLHGDVDGGMRTVYFNGLETIDLNDYLSNFPPREGRSVRGWSFDLVGDDFVGDPTYLTDLNIGLDHSGKTIYLYYVDNPVITFSTGAYDSLQDQVIQKHIDFAVPYGSTVVLADYISAIEGSFDFPVSVVNFLVSDHGHPSPIERIEIVTGNMTISCIMQEKRAQIRLKSYFGDSETASMDIIDERIFVNGETISPDMFVGFVTIATDAAKLAIDLRNEIFDAYTITTEFMGKPVKDGEYVVGKDTAFGELDFVVRVVKTKYIVRFWFSNEEHKELHYIYASPIETPEKIRIPESPASWTVNVGALNANVYEFLGWTLESVGVKEWDEKRTEYNWLDENLIVESDTEVYAAMTFNRGTLSPGNDTDYNDGKGIEPSFWQKIGNFFKGDGINRTLKIIGIVLLFLLLIPLLPAIFRLLFWILSIPVKLCKAIGKASKRHKANKLRKIK